MAALSTSLDKLLVTQTDLGAATPLDMRVAMIRMLKDMGFASVTIGNTAPADKKVLWWHKDIKTAKRYNAVTLSWDALTTDQWTLHILHRAFTAAGVDTAAATNDLFPFYDISLGETRMIPLANLLSLLGGEIPVISSSATEFIIDLTQLESDVHYSFYGTMRWISVQSENSPIRMRIRNSSNSNIPINYIGGDTTSGNVGGGGSFEDDVPFASAYGGSGNTDEASKPTCVAMQFGFMKTGTTSRVSLATSGGAIFQRASGFEVHTRPFGTSAAKIHFTLPSGTAMNGKVVRH